MKIVLYILIFLSAGFTIYFISSNKPVYGTISWIVFVVLSVYRVNKTLNTKL